MRAISLLAIGSTAALALVLTAPPARATDAVITCAGTSQDIATINNAITTVARSGAGSLQIAPGTCLVGGSPIVLQSNVTLTGPAPGHGTATLRQSGFTNEALIQANNRNPSAGLTNIAIENLTIDGRNLSTRRANISQATTSGTTTTLHFRALPSGIGAGMPVRDVTNPGGLVNGTIVAAVTGTDVVVTCGGTLTDCVNGTIDVGDDIAFYSTSVAIDAEWLDGLTIENVGIVNDSGLASIVIQGDRNFLIANNAVSVSSPDAQAIGTVLLTGRTANTPPGGAWNHDGFIFHNSLTNAALEIGGTSIVVSANMIVPGFGTGIVSEGLDGAGDPISEYNTFQGNTVHDSQTGLNHDGIVAGGLEIWDTNSLVYGNVAYRNGAQGILAGGPNNVIADNVTYDNNQSTLIPNGTAGINIVDGASQADNTLLTANTSCNTNGTYPVNGASSCYTTQNAGRQPYALYVGTDANGLPIQGTHVQTDNVFLPGSASPNAINGSYSSDTIDPEATISASQCRLLSAAGTCNSTITWSSSNATEVSVWVANSSDPSHFEEMAGTQIGATTVPWIGNHVYVFEVITSRGELASTTMQPIIAQ